MIKAIIPKTNGLRFLYTSKNDVRNKIGIITSQYVTKKPKWLLSFSQRSASFFERKNIFFLLTVWVVKTVYQFFVTLDVVVYGSVQGN